MSPRFALAFLLFVATAAFGADITVMYSGGLSPVVEKTKASFEAESGHKLVLVRGEPADVLVMAGDAFDEMVKRGHGAAGSRVDVANSSIAMGVKAGHPKPDISSVEALKKALLEAPKVAISRSASGGLAAKAVQREAAKAYLDYLGSNKVREAIDAAGLEPPTR